jgi:hypothetical protein
MTRETSSLERNMRQIEYPFLIENDGISVLPVTSLWTNSPSRSYSPGSSNFVAPHTEQRLAAARAAADQSGAASRQTAESDLIEAADAGRTFRKTVRTAFGRCSLRFL